MARLFIAVALDPDAVERLARVRTEPWAEELPARWVDPERMHLTLRFLGETDDEGAREALTIAARSVTAFSIRHWGLGAFPSPRHTRVLWAGVDDAGTLTRVREAVEAALEGRGFTDEAQTFTPHVTLARLRPRHGVDLSETLPAPGDFGVTRVGELGLYQSDLGPDGPTYRRLSAAKL